MLSLSRTAPRLATRCRTSTSSTAAAAARPFLPTLTTTTTTTQPSKPRFYSSATSSLPEFSLKDKVLVVSGGGRGLGLVQAEALLEAGAREVHAIDRLTSPSDDFARVADKFSSSSSGGGGGSALQYHRIDVRESEALNGAVEAIAERHGRIDGLVAAAGVQQATPALEYNQEDSDRMLGINVTGVFMTAQAVARQMVRLGQGGSIALIASMSGTIANKGLLCPVYNASKAAVIQLGRNLAAEWGQHGIRVNTISPGYIVTAMTEDLFKEHPEFRTNWTKENMLGRLSVPEEYRGAAVFLLSDASSFMTGSDLRIDGGHAAW
ncbi:hypothetical protein MCOR25_002661 [Pyricularia grisea]|uniref:Uncharacterized protein n=1 Tax=Pyricularia grisea TaxID=148305 RepID=A0A6P8BI83_PYRGI|nr:uncharacterized protein PgNI_00420 [Pyricularia grisea]KAI6377165.1 hypothetical protein MCOR25_002661 [Pyricularia grisea]TLD16596.1 hypothetical protein PgNI_00420 [Pyricularia grisea]